MSIEAEEMDQALLDALNDIIENAPDENDNPVIYRYYQDFGRMGELEGVFVARPSDIRKVTGHTAHFGEVLGKHSDVSSSDWDAYLEVLNDEPDFVEKAIACGLVGIGYNPLDYIYDYEDESED